MGSYISTELSVVEEAKEQPVMEQEVKEQYFIDALMALGAENLTQVVWLRCETKVAESPWDVYKRADGKMLVTHPGRGKRVLLLRSDGSEVAEFIMNVDNVDEVKDVDERQRLLHLPYSVCEDEKYTYVNHRIVVYDKCTKEVVRFVCGNGRGDRNDKLYSPKQVRVYKGFLYVADSMNA